MMLKPRHRHSLVTLALLLALSAFIWLSQRYSWQYDLTANAGNSLSPATVTLLATLPEPVTITAYLHKGQSLRLQVGQLLDRYHRHKADLSYRFVDPNSQPEQARELEIGAQGAVIVEYQGRSQKISFLDESALTNALFQLSHNQQRWVSFLTGHGERSALGIANFDYGRFGKELARRNITAVDLNLAMVAEVPANSQLLVIAAPSVALLPGEIEIIHKCLEQGRDFLLLSDPGNLHLSPLLERIGVRQLTGTIADNGGALYGLNDPSYVIAHHYPDHPISRGLQLTTVYPGLAAFETDKTYGFQSQTVLESSDTTWLETGSMKNAVAFDKLERKGPLTFGIALTRTIKGHEQRILVLGDSDFIANAYLDNVGNRDMGFRLFNWLIHDDRYIDIPVKIATDKSLHLSSVAVALIGFGFFLGLPILLLAGGIWVWLARRRK